MTRYAYAHMQVDKYEEEDTMVQIFKALSEESRLRILSLFLEGGDLCVCEVEAILGMTQSNASRHLILLKNCGLLENYRKAQWMYYRLNQTFISDNKELWDYLFAKLKASKTYNADFNKLKVCRAADLCGCKRKKEK